jgi:hypothetical protein
MRPFRPSPDFLGISDFRAKSSLLAASSNYFGSQQFQHELVSEWQSLSARGARTVKMAGRAGKLLRIEMKACLAGMNFHRFVPFPFVQNLLNLENLFDGERM